MLRLAAFCVLMAATTSTVVAAPPYEPLPGSKRSSSQYNPAPTASSSQSSTPATTYGSGVKTYGTGGGESEFSYTPAVDPGRPAGSSAQSGAAPGWDNYSQMQQMQQELQQLRGTVEQLTHDIEMMQKQSRERYVDLDTRINQLRGNPAASADEALPVVAEGQSGGDDKELYDQASQLRRDGKYPEAVAVLENLLKQSPTGLYAPYCEYWLGELFMVMNPPQLDVAKRYFISLIANNPDHVKVPDAMFKLGKLFATQGEKSKAKSTLNELIKKYPEKSAANLGRDLLKTL